jgi:hypothetical protein
VRVVAVDKTGNKSGPSNAATATALLIDDAHISDLTVSKVTAGTIGADFIVGARIKTADTGSRVELNSGGIGAWNAAGTQTVAIAAADGSVSIVGQLKSGTTGKRLEINPTSTLLPEIRFYANTGTDYGFINAFSTGTDVAVGVSSSPFDDSGVSVQSRALMNTSGAQLELIRADDQTRRGGYVWAFPGSLFLGYNKNGVEGGSIVAGDTSLVVGYRDGTSNENTLQFGNNGLTQQLGKWYSEARGFGAVLITPVANTPTSATITGLTTKGDSFFAFSTPNTTVVGSQVMGTSVSSVTSTGLTLWIYRTNTTSTTVYWMHVGWI